MGFLSKLLPIAGTAIGAAVGMPKVGAAIGSAAGSALSKSGGASKATKAQLQAIEDAKKAASDAKAESLGYLKPGLDAYGAGVNALTGRFGLGAADPAKVADDKGLPTANALTGGQYGDLTNPTAPDAYSAPAAPGGFSFNVNDFVNSPILQAALKRGVGAATGSAAAQGNLMSGATLKALTDYGLDSSYKFFDNERAFNYGMSRDAMSDWRDQRDFGYGMSRDNRRDYEDQRNYLTGRYDQGTNDLFRYTGLGDTATGRAVGVAGNYGNQMVDLAIGRGEAKANNALTQGGIGSDFAGDLGGILAGIYGGSGLDADVKRLAAANPRLF